MKIIIKNNNRILVKDDGNEIRVNDGDIVQYNGVYYKDIINEIVHIAEIETSFIGIVETQKYRRDEGIQGIYIKPLYIWSIINREWNKINDFEPPNTKYFLYPHLLMLPTKYYHFKPLYFLHTCKNCSLYDFNNIKKEFSLGKIPFP